MDDYSMMMFLEAGENVVRCSQRYESYDGCGLIPIGEKVESIRTSGLKYNMGNKDDPIRSLDFKEMISTSNSRISDEILIITSHPILFSTSLNT